MRVPFTHTRTFTGPCCFLTMRGPVLMTTRASTQVNLMLTIDELTLTLTLPLTLPQVNLMLTFEDRESFHLRKTFNSNGGFRQSYLHVGDGAGQKR